MPNRPGPSRPCLVPCAVTASWLLGSRSQATVAAIGYTRHHGKLLGPAASVLMLYHSRSQNPGPPQYLDSQVLLIESPAVAERAASIANSALNRRACLLSNFCQSAAAKVDIFPPLGAAAGAYGASIIGVTFTALNPQVAQARRQRHAPGL